MTNMRNDKTACGLPARARGLHQQFAIAFGMFSFLCATALADPAPWFYWKSVATGDRICAQFPPEDGWIKDGGPYKDARCANRFR